MKSKLLSVERLQKMSFYFVMILLSLGVMFITQRLYAITPFGAGVVLVLLILAMPLALMTAFDKDTTH